MLGKGSCHVIREQWRAAFRPWRCTFGIAATTAHLISNIFSVACAALSDRAPSILKPALSLPLWHARFDHDLHRAAGVASDRLRRQGGQFSHAGNLPRGGGGDQSVIERESKRDRKGIKVRSKGNQNACVFRGSWRCPAGVKWSAPLAGAWSPHRRQPGGAWQLVS